MVSVNELVIGVGIALGNQPANACPAVQNSQGGVDIAQIIAAVKSPSRAAQVLHRSSFIERLHRSIHHRILDLRA